MKKMNPEERVVQYNKKFPTHPPLAFNKRWITGAWYFVRSKRGKIYGSYPDAYLKRIYNLFPDCNNILHLFSGSLSKKEKGLRFDINKIHKPDICGDVRCVKKYFRTNQFDLIIADPPYETKDFKIYGCEPFNKGQVIKDLYRIIQPNGFIIWLDLIIPMHKKEQWQMMGMIAFGQGCGMRARAISIFQTQKGVKK